MYILMPTSYICFEDDRVFVGNILKKNSMIKFNRIEDIKPNGKTLEQEIFVSDTEISAIKDSYYHKLEKKYHNTATKIGYIETTSLCPYHCKMCPKYNHRINRENIAMNEETFNKIASQLKSQTEVELHLFGDPLCDIAIYNRIKTLNQIGIRPSFSTNLVSLRNICLEKLADIKIGRLTISCDADDHRIFSNIRGGISKEAMMDCYSFIDQIAVLAKKTDCIEMLILQQIKMKYNKDYGNLIRRIADTHDKCQYVEKDFIEFPNSERSKLGRSIEYTGCEKILLYNILKKRTPFKCLKVWDKREQAVTCDGHVVPCCMSYNKAGSFGNVNNQTLSQIQMGEKHKTFRQKIWEGDSTNKICDSCFHDQQWITHTRFNISSANQLRSRCVESW